MSQRHLAARRPSRAGVRTARKEPGSAARAACLIAVRCQGPAWLLDDHIGRTVSVQIAVGERKCAEGCTSLRGSGRTSFREGRARSSRCTWPSRPERASAVWLPVVSRGRVAGAANAADQCIGNAVTVEIDRRAAERIEAAVR